MPRFIFPLLTLLVAGLSISVDWKPPAPDSPMCRYAGCRYDQIYTGVDASGASPTALAALLVADSGNPHIWCTYGDLLSASGETEKAAAAFDRALALGPGMAPVLMRVANFDFTHDRIEEALQLTPRILLQTSNFDGILFSYLETSGEPVSKMLGRAIPATPRVAGSWLSWMRARGFSDRDLIDTWTWVSRYHLADDKAAVDTTQALWQHKSYETSQELWANWLGARAGDYLHPELLENTRFDRPPDGTPFDWNLGSTSSVEMTRHDGLEVHFLGKENLDFTGVQQFTSVKPGRYVFTAEIAADSLTTDMGPYFHIVDSENAGRLNVETQPILDSVRRSPIRAEFTVPLGTRVIQIQLVRRPSLKFDSDISGTLHIYSVSLVPLGRNPV